MKKFLLIGATLSILSFTGIAAISKMPTNDMDTRSGCCSHHGGVAYCGKSGYYICNDGTQSPSCTCR